MKRHLSLILLVALCLLVFGACWWAQRLAYGAECGENACSEPMQYARMSAPMLGASSGAAECAGVCCDSFDRGDNSDVTAGAPITWAETDTNGKLEIISKYLDFNADVTNNFAYVTTTTSCFPSVPTHTTVKFVLRFPHASDGTLADLHQAVSSASKSMALARLRDGTNTVAYLEFVSDGSGNLKYMRCARYSGGVYQEVSSLITINTLSTNTDYDGYLYFFKDATNGTVACNIGSIGAANTGANDTSAEEIDTLNFGPTSTSFGDGTNDVHFQWKNLVVYNTDAR